MQLTCGSFSWVQVSNLLRNQQKLLWYLKQKSNASTFSEVTAGTSRISGRSTRERKPICKNLRDNWFMNHFSELNVLGWNNLQSELFLNIVCTTNSCSAFRQKKSVSSLMIASITWLVMWKILLYYSIKGTFSLCFTEQLQELNFNLWPAV